ncbi:MAG: signal peptidase I [Actinobacteria bacterium]|nr:signal peptidase I [Actinomycetota bacterium]
MVEKDDKDSEAEQWVDDVVARAVERSIENAPEFSPDDIEKSADEQSISSSISSDNVRENNDSLEDLSTPPISSSDSPYPDEEFLDIDTETGEGEQNKKGMKSFLEWGAVILGALLVAFLIKTFLMQAYYIPSSSMTPTLQVGDRVLVNKLSYEVGDISRGDLVVFGRPSSENTGKTDLIKRVIGLEGELIEIIEGRIYITKSDSSSRQLLVEPYLASTTYTRGFDNTDLCERATETSCLIPENHVFVLGDNRDGSRDSRFFGPIDETAVVGRAFIRLWPIGSLKFL